MHLKDPDAAIAAVRADYENRPSSACRSQLGELAIVKPDGEGLRAGLLWIMGFNVGETSGEKDAVGATPSARRWFELCRAAADAVGSPAWIIGERVHWGSPTVGELVRRVGGAERFRSLLRLHADANKALLHAYRPSVVWMTGLSTFMAEAEEDYGLRKVDGPAPRDKRGRLWIQYVDAEDVPWLVTAHPTGARMSTAEFERVKAKLATIKGR